MKFSVKAEYLVLLQLKPFAKVHSHSYVEPGSQTNDSRSWEKV